MYSTYLKTKHGESTYQQMFKKPPKHFLDLTQRRRLKLILQEIQIHFCAANADCPKLKREKRERLRRAAAEEEAKKRRTADDRRTQEQHDTAMQLIKEDKEEKSYRNTCKKAIQSELGFLYKTISLSALLPGGVLYVFKGALDKFQDFLSNRLWEPENYYAKLIATAWNSSLQVLLSTSEFGE